MVTKKMYFMDCHLAGRKYHDADEVWDELKVGNVLRLERDKDNYTDPHAVAVMYDRQNKKETESFCLGYIPRGENVELANFLDMGWNNVFECRISGIKPEAHPENQVHLTIKIKRNDA